MFLYYLPGVTALSGETIARFGLSERLGTAGPASDIERIGGAQLQRRPPREGEPANTLQVGTGFLTGLWSHNQPEIKLAPDEQSWVWVPEENGRPEYAIGWYTRQPPTPQSLLREQTVDGELVHLADGNPWLIPVARMPPYATRIPLVIRWEGGPETGRVVSQVDPAWKWLWDLSGEVWELWFGSNPGTMQSRYRLAVRILSANYRVGPVECGALGLLSTPTITDIFRVIIDAERFVEFFDTPQGKETLQALNLSAKGTRAAGEPGSESTPLEDSSISPGPQVDSMPTVPAAPN